MLYCIAYYARLCEREKTTNNKEVWRTEQCFNDIVLLICFFRRPLQDFSYVREKKKKRENKLKRRMDNRKMVDDIVLLMFVQMGKILNAECTMYI